MKQIWVITKRELGSFFDSLTAYILIILFLAFCGLFTWLLGGNVFDREQASMQTFFSIAFWVLFVFIPTLTMRLIAEENKTGTIELLLTKPVNDWQVVIGKFLSTMILICIALLLTLPYYITIWNLGPVDHGAVWSGYLGLILMSATYASIGIFASCVTNNQIIAILLTFLIGIFFHLVFGLISFSIRGVLGEIFDYMSLSTHFESISRGVIDSKDLIYFLSLIFMGLFISEAVMAKRNLAN